MASKIKRIERTTFAAKDSNGMPCRIQVLTSILDVSHSEDRNAEIKGLAELKTEDGRAVNVIAKGKYQVVQTGEILTSSDPKAV